MEGVKAQMDNIETMVQSLIDAGKIAVDDE